jgi:hypothetical protein
LEKHTGSLNASFVLSGQFGPNSVHKRSGLCALLSTPGNEMRTKSSNTILLLKTICSVVGSLAEDKKSLPVLLLCQTADQIKVTKRYEKPENDDHLKLISVLAECMNGTASKDTAITNTGKLL